MSGRLSKLADFFERHRTSAAAGGLLAAAAAAFLWNRTRPSNLRKWAPGQNRLATGEFDGDRLTLRNVRNYSWRKEDDPEPRYEDRVYDLAALDSLDFVVSRFGMKGLAAHTILSFGFAGGERLALSVEVRRRIGQHFGILPGLLRAFEIIYIFADERDVLRLRTNVRGEPTWVFPINAPPAKVRALLSAAVRRANALAEAPEFYHSVKNACTTNLIKHFNEAGICDYPELGPRSVVSGLSDGMLHKLGLIGKGETLKELRDKSFVNDKARACGDGPDYSRAIRK